MCGSLLSKFKPRNRVDPILTEPRRVKSKMKSNVEDAACHEDRGFWKEGESNGNSSISSAAVSPSKTSMKNESQIESKCSSGQDMEVAVRTLDCAKPVLPAINSKEVTAPRAQHNLDHLLESAREILALQAVAASSSFNAVASQPLSSTTSNSAPLKIKPSVTFNVSATEDKIVCPSARVPRRLRKRGKVAPELNLEEWKERMRFAEERKMKELERIKESARSGIGVSRPHPADVSAKVTKEKLAAKQAAAERKRNEEMENRRQAGNKVSQKISKIAEAKAFAKTQLESSLEKKLEKTEERKVKHQQKNERKKKQKQLREEYAKKVKERVSFSVANYFTPNDIHNSNSMMCLICS